MLLKLEYSIATVKQAIHVIPNLKSVITVFVPTCGSGDNTAMEFHYTRRWATWGDVLWFTNQPKRSHGTLSGVRTFPHSLHWFLWGLTGDNELICQVAVVTEVCSIYSYSAAITWTQQECDKHFSIHDGLALQAKWVSWDRFCCCLDAYSCLFSFAVECAAFITNWSPCK